jgi:histidinol-phosphatase (PHP family)
VHNADFPIGFLANPSDHATSILGKFSDSHHFAYFQEVFFMLIRYDSHLHSDFSGDSDTPSEQMVERAIELGLSGICFTEHHDPDHPDYGIDFMLDHDAYFQKITQLRAQYEGRIQLRTGMEFGIMKHLPPVLDGLLSRYPFDFIIASLHFVDGKDPYYPDFFEGHTEHECYEHFFRAEYETLKCFPPDSYDTLGHLDFVVRYGPNRNLNYSYEAYADSIDPILRLLIENGKCLEVNTGGLKYGLGEPNPCSGVLRRYRELGGELITLGSDAHEPKHLAYDFDVAADLLTSLGFRYYTVFEQRKAQQIRL